MEVSLLNLSSKSFFSIGFKLGKEYLCLLLQDILFDYAVK